jgi:UDP-glucose-4-epimerase GalE
VAILVTGGAGYIGSHAAHALRRAGYEVIIYDNLSTGFRRLAKGFELIEGDIGDKSRLQPVLARVDAVLHFAAHAYVGESVAAPRKYFGNNVVAALSLLNSVVDAGIRRFVFSSSCAVYGVPERMPITERTAREPVNPYGASKLFFEHALAGYSRAYGLRSMRLRYFNAAGADEGGLSGELHEPETHLIPLALAACTEHGPALSIYGSDYATPDGTCIRDYIHVSDLADAHVRALQYLERTGSEEPADANAGEAGSLAVNLGAGRGYSVLEVIQAAERATGRAVRRSVVARRSGDPPALVADAAKARQILGWTARRKLDDMVSSAWGWMRKTSVGASTATSANASFETTAGARRPAASTRPGDNAPDDFLKSIKRA